MVWLVIIAAILVVTAGAGAEIEAAVMSGKYPVGGDQTAHSPKVVAAAIAFARQEGFYVSGSIPQRANNPGDLELGDFGLGVIGEGITVFPDLDSGWNAAFDDVNTVASGRSSTHPLSMTWRDFGFSYSGGDPQWAANVCSILGVSQDSTLGAYFS